MCSYQKKFWVLKAKRSKFSGKEGGSPPSTQSFSSCLLDLARSFVTSPNGIPADSFGDIMIFPAKTSEREENAFVLGLVADRPVFLS